MKETFLSGPVMMGQRAMFLNGKKVDLEIRKTFFLNDDTGTGFPDSWWMPHHWKCSR